MRYSTSFLQATLQEFIGVGSCLWLITRRQRLWLTKGECVSLLVHDFEKSTKTSNTCLKKIIKYDCYFQLTFSCEDWFHENEHILNVKCLIFRSLLTSNPRWVYSHWCQVEKHVRLYSYLDQQSLSLSLSILWLPSRCSRVVLNWDFIYFAWNN